MSCKGNKELDHEKPCEKNGMRLKDVMQRNDIRSVRNVINKVESTCSVLWHW